MFVCGIIGPTLGNLYMHIDTRSFNNKDMQKILKEIRKRAGPDMGLAIVLDQASYHRSWEVRELAASPLIDIKLIYNITARPDLGTVGIENVWSVCKSRFRASVDNLRAVNLPFDNFGLVQSVVDSITHEMARKLASKTIPAVEAGRPIEPIPNEGRQGNPKDFLIFSPQRQCLDHDFYRMPNAQ